MKLHRRNWLNKSAKSFAKYFSIIFRIDFFEKLFRATDAYINFLMGKGAGTGWALNQEISCAVAMIDRKNPIVFDIGANTGEWSKQMVQAMPEARIYMFEPSKYCQNILQDLAIKNAILIPCAVGDKMGEELLNFSSETDGSASLHQREDSYFQENQYRQQLVKVTTIDALIADKDIDYVDFMKMDIEGHELFALKGAKESLESRKIRSLSFEFGSGNINSRTYFRDFWKLLNEAGFKIYRVLPSGSLIQIKSYYEDLEYYRGVSNYFAKLADHTNQVQSGHTL